jgi:hypothetical protein
MPQVATPEALLQEVIPSSLATKAFAPSTGLKLTPWPDMLRYTRLTSLFSERDLTFPQDVLGTFAGSHRHLSRVFPGSFVSSMPAMYFDAALLWQS